MIRTDLTKRLAEAVARLRAHGKLDCAFTIAPELSEPRSPEHGDFATNYGLVASKEAGVPAPVLGAMLADELRSDAAFSSAETAGPGFVNLRLADEYLTEWAKRAGGDHPIGRPEQPHPQKILIEFVSVNPNGPIHLGHGRGAAFGDTLARVLQAAGNDVSREYYVNDGVNSTQMQLFGLSVKALYRKALGLPFEFPEGGYKGEDVADLAASIKEEYGEGHPEDGLDFWQPSSQELMLERQRADLERFGVTFDRWFREQSLHESNEVQEAIDALTKQGHVYDQDGALFLKSTDFGDDKDRCVVRSTGEPTYIASDIAYHKDKFDRGFDYLINIWGPDHHGYVGRTQAAIQALGYPKARLELIITQIVRFIQNGAPAPMKKRNGEYYRLSDLMDELGVDVVRFFYLMRSHDTHMDFDIDLAREHSDKNPVFYVQYAHARLSSLINKAAEQGLVPDETHMGLLTSEAERNLIKKIWDLPHEIVRCAEDRGVHRLTTYCTELARDYHNFYDKCPVIRAESKELAGARLALCGATRKTLRETFALLGISAPESM
ncbi:MAG: arginine--tRNA ligase [Fimbriimonadales bacterium]